ncbi:unnamed protein product [Boreogadus saida]
MVQALDQKYQAYPHRVRASNPRREICIYTSQTAHRRLVPSVIGVWGLRSDTEPRNILSCAATAAKGTETKASRLKQCLPLFHDSRRTACLRAQAKELEMCECAR